MILDYYVRRITIAAATLVCAARCSARSTRTACALGVIARARVLVLAGRTAAISITWSLALLLVIVIHEFDVVRNQVIDTASVLQQAIRRTEGRNEALHELGVGILLVLHGTAGDEAEVKLAKAEQLDVVTLLQVLLHVVSIAVEYRLYVCRSSIDSRWLVWRINICT